MIDCIVFIKQDTKLLYQQLFWIAAKVYVIPKLGHINYNSILVPLLLLHATRHFGLMFLEPGATKPGLILFSKFFLLQTKYIGDYLCNTMNAITYGFATTAADYEKGKILFEEYVQSIGVDLSFQDFAKELSTIDVQYNHPSGALLLAYAESKVIGCAGIRKLDDEVAELKRMYIRGEYRGYGIGVQMLEQSLQKAKELGYKKIRLDTLKSMEKAQALYRSFGFYEIPSYRFNPLEGTVYMEKVLRAP